MKHLHLLIIIACSGLMASAATGNESAQQESASDDNPINATCPISKEPITASAGTVEYEGQSIGFCCAGCIRAFNAWDDARKDEFVALATASSASSQSTQPAMPSSDEQTPEKQATEVTKDEILAAQMLHYPIDTCIVGGGKLGSMGDPVNHIHSGRLFRFCCAGCIPTFEKDPDEFIKALDTKIVEQQLDGYPLDTCVVADGTLGSMGEPVNYIYENRLVRFCCASCIEPFESDPKPFIEKLDKAYADAQRADYPLDTCVVAGGKLGSMGDPVELIAGTRLVRFCCDGCFPSFTEDPQKYLAKLPAE